MESGNSAVDRQEREDREAELYSGELKASEMTNEEKEAQEVKLEEEDYSLLKAIAVRFNTTAAEEARTILVKYGSLFKASGEQTEKPGSATEDFSLRGEVFSLAKETVEALELARKDLSLDTREATYTLIIKGFLKYGRQGVKPGKPAGK